MVRRDMQGKGVGTMLMNTIRDEATKRGDPLGLATTTALNAEIYQKMGFTSRGYSHLPSPWGEWDSWLFTMTTVSDEPKHDATH